jgi:hypothetical protein
MRQELPKVGFPMRIVELTPVKSRRGKRFAGILMGVVFIGGGIAQIVKARGLENDEEPAA